jgi:hypothetical protein
MSFGKVLAVVTSGEEVARRWSKASWSAMAHEHATESTVTQWALAKGANPGHALYRFGFSVRRVVIPEDKGVPTLLPDVVTPFSPLAAWQRGDNASVAGSVAHTSVTRAGMRASYPQSSAGSAVARPPGGGKPLQAASAVGFGGTCFVCKLPGHKAADCPRRFR